MLLLNGVFIFLILENVSGRHNYTEISENAQYLPGDMVDKASQAIDIVADTAGKIVDVIQSTNILGIFAAISSSLAALGPAFMAISAILSIVSMFLPQAESPELKALNKGFEKINTRLEGVKTSLNELKMIIELSSAKTALVNVFDTIDNLESEHIVARKRGSKIAWHYFNDVFAKEYNGAADTFYNAMIGDDGDAEFRFDLLNLFREKFSCSVKSISRVCILTMQTINRAISLEAAYLASSNFPTRVKVLRVQWHRRLAKFKERCGTMLMECESQAENYRVKTFEEFYNTKVHEYSTHEFAKHGYFLLTESSPERVWGVFACDGHDSDSFKLGWHIATETKFTRVNANGKTVFTVYYGENPHYDIVNLGKHIDYIVEQMTSARNCYWNDKGPLYYSTAHWLVEQIEAEFKQAAIIVAAEDLHPEFINHPGRGQRRTIGKTPCIEHVLQLYVFV